MAFVCGAPPGSLHGSRACRATSAPAVGRVPQRRGQLSAVTEETGTGAGGRPFRGEAVDVWSQEGRARAFQEGVLTSVSQVVWGALCSLWEPVKLQLTTTHRWLSASSTACSTPKPRGPLRCGELPVLREGALPPLPHLPSLLVTRSRAPSPSPPTLSTLWRKPGAAGTRELAVWPDVPGFEPWFCFQSFPFTSGLP